MTREDGCYGSISIRNVTHFLLLASTGREISDVNKWVGHQRYDHDVIVFICSCVLWPNRVNNKWGQVRKKERLVNQRLDCKHTRWGRSMLRGPTITLRCQSIECGPNACSSVLAGRKRYRDLRPCGTLPWSPSLWSDLSDDKGPLRSQLSDFFKKQQREGDLDLGWVPFELA